VQSGAQQLLALFLVFRQGVAIGAPVPDDDAAAATNSSASGMP
jgi:hypothetical protein